MEDMVTEGVVLGIKSHAEIGQQYLENLGIPDAVCYLVGKHVQAKQYLVAVDQTYCK